MHNEVKKGPGRPRKVQTMVLDEAIAVLDDAPELEPEDNTLLPVAASTISPDIQALLLAMNAQTMSAIAEMKKPSAEEQEKIDQKKERERLAHIANMRAIAQQEETFKAAQAYCAHSKPNGKTSFTGQVNSDNCYRLFCPYCHYISPSIHATPEQIASGLNLTNLDAHRLTIKGLEAAAASATNLPPDPIRTIPIGWVVDNANL